MVNNEERFCVRALLCVYFRLLKLNNPFQQLKHFKILCKSFLPHCLLHVNFQLLQVTHLLKGVAVEPISIFQKIPNRFHVTPNRFHETPLILSPVTNSTHPQSGNLICVKFDFFSDIFICRSRIVFVWRPGDAVNDRGLWLLKTEALDMKIKPSFKATT